jgi:hypothetical protein
MRSHEPPYTQAEEDEFYRRVGRGPITVARPAGDRTKQTSQNSGSRRRQNRAALKGLLESIDPAPLLADKPARVLDVLARRAALR